jgi:hypothetical protein
MKLKNYLYLIVLLFPLTFSSLNAYADEDEEEEYDERVDLFRVRDIVVRSYSVERYSATRTAEVSAEATFNDDEMTILIDNYYGDVVVSISGQSSGDFISESFSVNGSSECAIDISSLEPGEYTIEIETANSSFVGKFVI